MNAAFQELLKQVEAERCAAIEARKAENERKRREHRAMVIELLRDKAIIAYDAKTDTIVDMVLVRPGNAAWQKEVRPYMQEWFDCGLKYVAVYAECARCGGKAMTAIMNSYRDAFASLEII